MGRWLGVVALVVVGACKMKEAADAGAQADARPAADAAASTIDAAASTIDAAVPGVDAAAPDAGSTAGLPVWDPQRYPWPMQSHDVRRTGRSPTVGPLLGGASWSYTAKGASSINLQAVVGDGGVFFAGWGVSRRASAGDPPASWVKFDGAYFGLDADDGGERFPPFDPKPLPYCYRYASHPRTSRDAVCGDNLLDRVAFYNGTIEGTAVIDPVSGVHYFGRGDGNLFAVNPTTGAVVWIFRTFNPVDPDDPDGGGEIVGGPVLGPGRVIYFATFGVPWPDSPSNPNNETHAVYAVDTSGNLLWRYPKAEARDDNPFLASPALSPDGRTLYVATWFADGNAPGKLLALDLTKPASASDAERLRWSLPLRNTARAGNPGLWVRHISVGVDGTIYLACAQAKILGSLPAVMAVKADGQPRWSPAVVDFSSGPATLAQGLALWEEGSTVVRVHVTTGITRDSNGTGGTLYLLDAATGEVLATWDPGDASPGGIGGLTAPTLGNDETVYVGTRGRHDLLAAPDTGQWRRGRMYAVRRNNSTYKILWSRESPGLLDWVAPAIDETGRLFYGSTDQFSPLLDQNTFFAPGAATPEHDPKFAAVWDGPTCPVGGRYTLTKIACGPNDITADWKARVPESLSTVSAAADRCKISLVNRSPTCSETQPFEAVPAGDAWTVSTTGISACDPLGCTFGEGDEGCQLLDRAGSWGETIVIAETQFTTTRSGDGTICTRFNLPLITTWTKE